MSGSINVQALGTQTITQSGSFNPVNVAALGTVDVSGTGVSVVFDGITAPLLSTEKVENGAKLKIAGLNANVLSSFVIGSNGTLEFVSPISVLSGTTFTTPNGTLVLDSTGLGVLSNISGFTTGDKIFGAGSVTAVTASTGLLGATSVTLTTSTGIQVLSLVGAYDTNQFRINGDGSVGVACFLRGTQILTVTGWQAVETLEEGDRVLNRDGAARPIRWIGRRRYIASTLNRPEMVQPIRIRQGAVAQNTPRRDLYVSPEHALYIAGVLVPARHLVNGVTVTRQADIELIEYFHIELDHHDIILAEGMATESYLDTGNRGMFSNARGQVVHHPFNGPDEAAEAWSSRGCAPLVTSGPELAAIQQALLDQAEELGLATVTEDPGLHLLIDGRVTRPIGVSGSVHVFKVPHGAATIAIASRSRRGSLLSATSRDDRHLGVAIGRLTIRNGGAATQVMLTDPSLTDGFYEPEFDGERMWRWTDGEAYLPESVLAGIDGPYVLEVQLAGSLRYLTAA